MTFRTAKSTAATLTLPVQLTQAARVTGKAPSGELWGEGPKGSTATAKGRFARHLCQLW